MKSVVFQRKEKILYGGKLWWGETLANLANDHKFAKFLLPTFPIATIASFVIKFLFNDIPRPLS